jgi:hypothetical protein
MLGRLFGRLLPQNPSQLSLQSDCTSESHMPPNIMALAVLLVFIIAFLVVLALIDIMAKFVSMILWKLKPKRKKQTRFFILFAFLVLKRREEDVSIKTNAVAFMPASWYEWTFT